jgi:hypothetical protein
MRGFALAAWVLIALIGCRKQQANETAGISDTAMSPAPAPAAELPDTAAVRPFSFDQRQEFARSIRQQLANIDQQITDLTSQAKSRGGAVSDRALANIVASRRAVERNLRRINSATAGNWEQVSQGLSQAVESLSESIEAAQPK